jgi:anti-sigma factor RsiW
MTTIGHPLARRYLHLALDDDLSPEQAAGLRAHLAGCPGCQAYANELDRLQALLSQAGRRYRRRSLLVSDLSVRVRTRLGREISQRFWLGLTGSVARAGSLVLIAVLVSRLLITSGPSSSIGVQPAAMPAVMPAATQAAPAVDAAAPALRQAIPAFELDEPDNAGAAPAHPQSTNASEADSAQSPARPPARPPALYPEIEKV